MRDVAAKYNSQSKPGERREMCGLTGEESQSCAAMEKMQIHPDAYKAPAGKFETISIVVQSAVCLSTKFVFSCIFAYNSVGSALSNSVSTMIKIQTAQKKKKGRISKITRT